MPAWLTKWTLHLSSAAPNPPNIGRAITGCGVGIDALPSPIIAPAMKPALDDELRLHAEERRLPQHEIRQLPDLDRSDLPEMPCAIAGLIVYFAM